MTINTLARHYDRLGAEERFRLILAAGARGDEAEQDRLSSIQALQQTAGHDSFMGHQALRCPAAAELGRSASEMHTLRFLV